MLRQLFARFAADSSGSLLRTTARTAAIVGLFSAASAYYLSDRLEAEKQALAEIAASATRDGRAARIAGRNGVDMTATGSIARGAQSVRLDPCAVPAKN